MSVLELECQVENSVFDENLQSVLDAGVWEFGSFIFASGEQANNKFEMGRVLRYPYDRLVLTDHNKAVAAHEPDLLISTPSGMDPFARRTAKKLGVPVCYLAKDKVVGGEKTYSFKSDEDREWLEEGNFERPVVLEDVITKLTSVSGVLALLMEVGITPVAVEAIMHRGDRSHEKKINAPVHALTTIEVPNIITPKHPFFKKYAKRAVNNHLIS